jgi:hypothetical protein
MPGRAIMRAVGWKDRIAATADRATELARDAADSAAAQKVRESAPVQSITDSYAGLSALLTDDEQREFVIERALLRLVATVRSDDDEALTDRDVEKAAKRRFKRARRTALLAGPAVGTANQVVDLYCETATVVDLDLLHGLGLTDERIAAHMLVLWNIAPDVAVAEASIHGTGPSVSALLSQRLGEHVAARMPDERTRTAVVKAIWNARGIAGDVSERVVGKRNITGTMFAGKRVKEFIARAEAVLGVMRLT